MTEPTPTQPQSRSSGGLHHAVLLYDTDAEFSAAIADFVHAGLAAGEPALVAAPSPRLDALRPALNGSGDAVTFVDVSSVGANPARLIPAYREFIDGHPARRLRMTGELMWPGRTAGEVAEVTRHEALLNLAFDGVPVSIQCLYDAGGVDSAALADLERAHPVVVRAGRGHANERYAGPGLSPFCDRPLPPPPADCVRRGFDDADDLPAVRGQVRDQAAHWGLPRARIADLVTAVNELVSNALVHGGGRGVLRAWRDAGTVTCEVTGPGQIADQLAGRRFAPASAGGAHGLWLVNQLCDLVELRSHRNRTTVRVHLRLDAQPGVAALPEPDVERVADSLRRSPFRRLIRAARAAVWRLR
jgi:anti-sigma regulatory factor (Ser/Thr protein kinase)